MAFTADQQRAIFTHHKNLIVTAGAGSGKTRVLVERYLSLLETNPDWKLTDLIAITFTEKAAREMRDRVRLTIQERIQNASEEADQKRWRNHEALLDSARIGTIHSLCAQILRSNPAEVPVDPNFEVLDEAAAAILLDDAVEQSLAELATSEVARLISYYGVSTVKQGLKKFSSLSESEKFLLAVPANVQELWTKWQTDFETASQKILTTIQTDEMLNACLQWHPDCLWPTNDKLADIWHEIHRLLENLNPTPDGVFALLTYFDKAIKLNVGSQKNWGESKEILTEAKENLGKIREIARAYLAEWPRALDTYDEQAAEFLILWRQAVEHTTRRYKALKDLQGVLDFDDLEFLTGDLLKKHPHVAERYALREMQHLLVDEFQDTNGAQRDIVYKLCGLDSDDAPHGRLFVVGDPKQSIYAFRGADVSVFREVTMSVQQKGGDEVPLNKSFRTHQRLVDGLNALFEQVLNPDSDDLFEVPFDRKMEAHRLSENYHAAPIRLILLNKAAAQEENLDSEQLRRWEAYEVVRLIKNLHDAQYPIFDKARGEYRPFTYDDCAILLRAMTHASTYEEIFKNEGLPYVTVAGKGYYDRQEVWDVINLLKALHNRSDNLALASVLRSPMFGLSDDAIFALRLIQQDETSREPIPLWDALQHMPEKVSPADSDAILFAREVLQDLAAVAGRVPVAELLSMALDKTAYDAILTALPDGDRRRGNIEKLMEKARQSGRVSLSDFTAYLGNLTAVDPREGEAALESVGSIKIMSVHASKGLEFPVVILMDANSKQRRPDSPPLQFDSTLGASCRIKDSEGEWLKLFAYQQAENLQKRRDHAEHKRLFYVAATRAQDLLILTGGVGKNGASEGSWLHMLQEAFEIDCSETADSGTYSYEWGGVQVDLLRQPPPDEVLSVLKMDVTGWDIVQGHLQGSAQIPPLLQPLFVQKADAAAHLTVSQLEKLGRADERDFRNSVLHDSPAPVVPIAVEDDARDYYIQRAVGQIVHRALRVGMLPSQTFAVRELYEILKAYAWDEGITDQFTLVEVINRAMRLLRNFEENNILVGAERILREIPFILRTDTRIIHGQIDVLYQMDGRWAVLDYKTANIRPNGVREHARRYHIQVGAYARAVERRLGQIPLVQLYYLHPGTLVMIPQHDWESALAELDTRVNTALGS